MKRRLYFGLGTGLLLIFMVWLAYRTPAPVVLQSTALFGGVPLHLDYATTTEGRELGLGGRISIPTDYGMLFVFAYDDRYGFWMKNTLVPLDMFWLNDKGHVVYMTENVATSSYPNVLYPTVPARYVLETVAGYGAAHNIATGTPLELKYFPSVSE